MNDYVTYQQNNKKTRSKKKSKIKSKFFKLVLLAISILTILNIFKSLYSNLPYELFKNSNGGNNNTSQISLAPTDENEKKSNAIVETDNWELILVNKDNPIPDNYTPTLKQVAGGECVDERIYEPLTNMLDAAQQAGYPPIIAAGYRTMEEQQALMQEKITYYMDNGYSEKDAKQIAERWVAIPGTSEHQLGLAVDINGFTYDIYTWLESNAHKYGFIKRYPQDKTDITGIMNEPWHFRYVGIEAATEIYEQGICLEEYLNMQ